MLFKRPDGRLIRGLDPIFQLISHVMTQRNDAQVFYKMDVRTDGMDEYIKKCYKDDGLDISYTDILIAALVRTIALRPQLNRFVVNSRVFARHEIVFSLSIKRVLDDASEETIVKFTFNGTETLEEISQNMRKTIQESMVSDNKTDELVASLMRLPHFFIKSAVRILKWMDLHNMLPASFLEGSPFHTGVFFTNTKSIGLNYVYHHIYNFGTAGLFLSIGKAHLVPTSGRGGMSVRRILSLGLTFDERICDGLYLANSMRTVQRYLSDPALLEAPLEERVRDID